MAASMVSRQGQSSIFGEIIYRFEKAFKEGDDPQPDAFLQGEGETRWQLLIELLHSNLELRLRAGHPLRVSEYLAKYPELAQRPEDLLALIETEWKCLQQLGQKPIVEEYESRFGAILGSRLSELLKETGSPPGDKNLGKVIAKRYTLVKELGHGGMGTVYLAEQSEPVKRQVALKLIKGGVVSQIDIVRFEAERQALALMDHPNIARVFDGGTTERQPFFVMELVQGIPITQYCDQQRLSPKARLELFVLICHAVQHAHQKGIIHRDLKPGNVLVTLVDGKPVPKVIDFGLAKATEQPLTDETINELGAVGTPAYMSPEQTTPGTMDVDTRTDIYALGVILYELMTGSTPIDSKQFRRGAILEMLRMVREVDPPRPITKLSSAEELPGIAANRDVEPKQLLAWVRGDVEWIVMKALEKQRERRYETANGFAADVQCYLRGEPVSAHPPSRWYLTKKYVRRNKVQVATISLVSIALVAGMIGALSMAFMLYQTERANHNFSVALEAASQITKQSEGVYDLGPVTRTVRVDIVQDRKSRLGVTEVLLKQLAEKSQGANETLQFQHARICLELGRVLSESDGPESAEPAYKKAMDIFQKLVQRNGNNSDYLQGLASALNRYGNIMLQTKAYSSAEELYSQSIDFRRKLTQLHPDDLTIQRDYLTTSMNLAIWYGELDKLKESSDLFDQVIAEQIAFNNKINSDDIRADLARARIEKGRVQSKLALASMNNRDLSSLYVENAENELKSARATLLDLKERYPARLEVDYMLANCLLEYGLLVYHCKSFEESDRFMDSAKESLDKVIENYLQNTPAMHQYKAALATWHYNKGDMAKGANEKIGHFKQADKLYSELANGSKIYEKDQQDTRTKLQSLQKKSTSPSP